MTPLETLVDAPVVHRVGWMLLHSLWEVTLVGLGLAVVLVLLKRRSANARYVAGCVALLLMAVLPMATLPLLVPSVEPDSVSSDGPGVPLALPRLHLSPGVPGTSTGLLASSPVTPAEPAPLSWHVRTMAVLEQNLSRIVIAWAAGVLVLSLRIVAGWFGAQRLRLRRCQPAEPCWQDHLEELVRRIGVTRPVQLLQSHLVRVPTVVRPSAAGGAAAGSRLDGPGASAGGGDPGARAGPHPPA